MKCRFYKKKGRTARNSKTGSSSCLVNNLKGESK